MTEKQDVYTRVTRTIIADLERGRAEGLVRIARYDTPDAAATSASAARSCACSAEASSFNKMSPFFTSVPD